MAMGIWRGARTRARLWRAWPMGLFANGVLLAVRSIQKRLARDSNVDAPPSKNWSPPSGPGHGEGNATSKTCPLPTAPPPACYSR